jgi:phosphoglycerate dehydrogenase-like enzyme
MKILIPEHISEEITQKIKAVSHDIEVARLKIIEKESVIRKILRKIASRTLSYKFYKRFDFLYRPKKKFSFFVGKERLNGQLKNTQVFLATWIINKDMFRTLLNYLPNLKWVHSTKTGTEHLSAHRLEERGVLLTNSSGIHSRRIAEFVMACIFEVSKHISGHIALKRMQKWEELKSTELAGKTVGILGTGSIGTEVAKKAKALEMKTFGYNRTVEQNPHFDKIVVPRQLQEVLGVSDFLVICLPLTQETKGLLGKIELTMMKPSAYIINIARSQIIQEDALIDALKKKTIAGAILDAFHPEMQLPNHPFYKLDNVLLTHYSAHASSSSNQEIFELFLKNIRLYLEEVRPPNILETP